jgi:hypothetical protein
LVICSSSTCTHYQSKQIIYKVSHYNISLISTIRAKKKSTYHNTQEQNYKFKD